MCDYCSSWFGDNKNISDDNDLDVEVNKESKQINIYYMGWECSHGFDINILYCPMCGEKLK